MGFPGSYDPKVAAGAFPRLFENAGKLRSQEGVKLPDAQQMIAVSYCFFILLAPFWRHILALSGTCRNYIV